MSSATCERDSLCVLAAGHYGPHQYATLEDAEAAATFTVEDRERMRLENRVRELEAKVAEVSKAETGGYHWAIKVAKAARTAYARLIEPIREAAKAKGYAVAVHGSLARDIDLVAVPWTPESVAAEELAGAVAEAVRSVTDGLAEVTADGRHGEKPHGRRCWVIMLGGGTYIDLSVMPRQRDLGVW